MSIFDHLWQSTLVAVLVYALTLLFRHNSARIRHGLWLAASLKFLVPFSLLAMLGGKLFVQPVPAQSFAVISRMRPVAMPFTATLPDHTPWPNVLIIVWALGATAIAGLWLLRWAKLFAIARQAQPLPLDLDVPVRATPALLEPGLVGIWQPVILLPQSIFQQLSRSEIDTILRHELCHHARRDNLMAALHMLVEAIFWFHPLVWFIGARLVEEREAACDERVLADGQNPLEYAEAILRVCRLYLRSPLSCASGVAGADLGRRVDTIMAGRALEDVDGFRKLVLTGLLLLAVALPVVTGTLRAAPPAQLVQQLASAFPTLPAIVAQVAAPAPVLAVPQRRRHTAAGAAPSLQVEVRTLAERDIPYAPSLIVITPPQLLAQPQAEESENKICRAPQQLTDSRLMGPRVCLTAREWKAIADRGMVLMPDGQRVAAYYEKQHSRAVGGCPPAGHGASLYSANSPGLCF